MVSDATEKNSVLDYSKEGEQDTRIGFWMFSEFCEKGIEILGKGLISVAY